MAAPEIKTSAVDTTMGVQVRVEGLREFRRALRQHADGGEIKKRISAANRDVSKAIQAGAKARAASRGGVAAKSGRFVQRRATQTGASVRLDASKPDRAFALGAEFGGGRRPTTKQFRPWLGGPGGGYFLWPVIREELPKRMAAYQEALDDIQRSAFPD